MDFFIHIPKAAGTTVGRILRHEYGYRKSLHIQDAHTFSRERVVYLEKSRQKSVVWGHFDHGIHEYLSPDRFRYFTILREPVDRVISHYFYAKREPSHYLHEIIKTKKVSLLDYVSSDLTMEVENGQCRQLSGVTPGQNRLSQKDIYGLADGNLSNMAAVGLTERLEDSLRVFNVRLGWRNKLKVTRANATTGRAKQNSIDDSVLRIIRERNQFDVMLYEKAESIFDGHLSCAQAEEEIQEFNQLETLIDKAVMRFLTYRENIHNHRYVQRKSRPA